MFTGLIETTGTLVSVQRAGRGVRWRVRVPVPDYLDRLAVGDSICVSGCCLTIVAIDGQEFECDLGEETLLRTTFNKKSPGAHLNLERSLRVGDAVGGHWVTGHVDGVGRLVRQEGSGDWVDYWFEAPRELLSQMAEKGSVAVDGVSLTLCQVTDREFRVALIPHTLRVTTLGELPVDSLVNIETDILAKYVARQLAVWRQALGAVVR